MVELGPGMYFFQEFLFKDQSRLKHANCMHLDDFHIPWKTTMRSLYGHLGSRPSKIGQSTIEHRFTFIALLFPQRPAPPANTSPLGCKMPDETVAYPPRKQWTLSLDTNSLKLTLYRDARVASSSSNGLGSNEGLLSIRP